MIVMDSNSLYQTCLVHLNGAIERKDEASFLFWGKVIFASFDKEEKHLNKQCVCSENTVNKDNKEV
jgi:hypothetical protein